MNMDFVFPRPEKSTQSNSKCHRVSFEVVADLSRKLLRRSDHQQELDIFLVIFTNMSPIEDFRCFLLMICSILQPPGLFFRPYERIINRTHHNTLNSIKASMVDGFIDKKAFREPGVVEVLLIVRSLFF